MRITESQVVQSAQRYHFASYDSYFEFRLEYPGMDEGKVRQVEKKTPVNTTMPTGLFDLKQEQLWNTHFRMVMQLMQLLFSSGNASTGTQKGGAAAETTTPMMSGDPATSNLDAKTQSHAGGAGIQLTLVIHDFCKEAESSQYCSSGTVKTADGRKIDFRTELALSREYASDSTSILALQTPQKLLIDPLILNYATPSASLSKKTFDFDLNADGQKEAISQLNGGSAYLALDNNRDGKINDGSELFGARSGDGFTELAGYDTDHNGWIDESDPVFASLKLWVKDDSGMDQLVDLKTKDVGAIYLGQARADFSLNDESNQQHGLLRASGVYLSEQGRAGSIQQVDMTA